MRFFSTRLKYIFFIKSVLGTAHCLVWKLIENVHRTAAIRITITRFQYVHNIVSANNTVLVQYDFESKTTSNTGATRFGVSRFPNWHELYQLSPIRSIATNRHYWQTQPVISRTSCRHFPKCRINTTLCEAPNKTYFTNNHSHL
jgi:hypothetical protein